MPASVILAQVLPQLPVLLVCAAGLVFALSAWSRWPRPALLAALGFGLMLVAILVPLGLQALVLRSANHGGMAAFRSVWMAVGFGGGILKALALALLAGAVFSGRSAS